MKISDLPSLGIAATGDEIIVVNSGGQTFKVPMNTALAWKSTALKWTTPRIISLSGDVSASLVIDGSEDKNGTATLANTGVAAGTYTSVTVDTKGRVLAGTTPAQQTITVSGDVTGSGTSNIILALATTGVGAGTYRSVTIDTKGRVTAATNPTTLSAYGITDAVPRVGNVTIAGPLAFGTSDTDGTANQKVTKLADPTNPQDAATKKYVDQITGAVAYTQGDGITISNSIISTRATARFGYNGAGALDLASSGVSPGTYTNVTVDTYGRVTSATNPTPVNQPITLSGAVSGSGTSTITTTLANSGVTAGTYTALTVNVKGIVTAATNPSSLTGMGLVVPIDDLSDVVITSPALNQVLAFNGTNWINTSPAAAADKFVAVSATDTTPDYLPSKLSFSSRFSTFTTGLNANEKFNVELATTGVSAGGPYNTFTVDAFGRITVANNTSGTNQPITLTGDALGTGATAITVALSETGVTAGTYTQVTVDAKGRVSLGANPTTRAGYGLTDAQPLSNILTSLTTNQTASGAYIVSVGSSGGVVLRTFVSSARITVTNGSGTGGNTSFDLAASGVTAGTYTKVAVDTFGRVLTGGVVQASDIQGLGTLATQNSGAVTVTGGTFSGISVAPRITTPVVTGSSITLNWTTSDTIRLTLTNDLIITNTGGVPGQKYTLEISQDSVGGHSVSFTGETIFGTDLIGVTLSTLPNLVDMIGFVYNEVSTKFRCVALTRGFPG